MPIPQNPLVTALLLALLLSIPLSRMAAQEMPFDDDPDFSVREIPEQWKELSVVLICQRRDWDFRGKKNVERQRVRFRMQDNSAIEEYGEVSYDEDEVPVIRIEKPDGSIHIVDMSQAVEVEREIETQGMWRRKKKKDSYFKLAIPNLEPGDIVDIGSVDEDASLTGSDLEEVYLQQPYAILRQRFHFYFPTGRIKVPKYKLRVLSIHGAPELEEAERGHFVLKDEMREPYERERWSIPAAHIPTFKFTLNAGYRRGFREGVDCFEITREGLDLVDDLDDIKRTASFSPPLRTEFHQYLKKVGKRDVSIEEAVQLFFYYSRYATLSGNHSNWPYFFLELKSVFKKLKDETEVNLISIQPRYITSAEEVLKRDELVYGLMFPRIDSAILIYVDKYHRWAETQMVLDGLSYQQQALVTDARLYPSGHNKTNRLRETRASENLTHSELEVDLSDPLKAKISVTIRAAGHAMDGYKYALLGEDVWAEDRIKFDDPKKLAHPPASGIELEDDLKLREERAISDMEGHFGEMELIGIELIEAGIGAGDTELVVKMELEKEDLCSKAGPNYLLAAGTLIGGQVQLEEDEFERSSDIYVAFARAYENLIRIVLPEGYSVSGIESLNMEVDNATGTFRSTVHMEDGQLVIYSYKEYKHLHEKKENWPLMREFLDAAYQFTQTKLLLKKTASR